MKKDFYNNQEGEQDNIFDNFINEPQIDPRLVRVEARLAEAEPIEPVRVEPIIIKKKKKLSKEQREEQPEAIKKEKIDCLQFLIIKMIKSLLTKLIYKMYI